MNTLAAFLFLCLPLLAANAEDKAAPLQLSLKCDKQVYHPDEEITFCETLRNTGKQPLHIFDDTCFRGSDVEFRRTADGKMWGWTGADGKVKWDGDWSESSGHTVKPGMRPSKNVVIKPGGTLVRTFTAFVTRDFKIAFQNHGGSAFTGFSSGKVTEAGLPQKYIGCGWIFNLKQSGTYETAVHYSNDEQWSNGGIGDQIALPAWTGFARSNTVAIELKQK